MSQDTMTKKRYYEPAPQDIDIENFRKVIESRRSVRKYTEKQIPADVLDACLDLALLAPNSSNLQPWTFYVVQSQAKKNKLVKACLSQLSAKTAAELIVCVARIDRIDEMAKNNLTHFPMPEAPRAVKQYYKFIAYNYKTGYLNALSNSSSNLITSLTCTSRPMIKISVSKHSRLSLKEARKKNSDFINLWSMKKRSK